MLDLTPDEFQRLAERAARAAADYLRALDAGPIQPRTSAAALAPLGGELPAKGLGPAALDALDAVIAGSRAQNGRFLGYVMGSGDPVGAVADLVASVVNQNLTAWRSSPAGITIEHAVVGWLGDAVGCRGFGGSLTGGGSSANLMALAMAREARVPANERGGPRGAVYASTEAHVSIAKAVALLGLGRENLRLVPVDDAFRMRVDALEAALARDAAAGLPAVAIVASAGTVATGSVDPIADLAGVAARHGAWLHVDGAYGALAALAAPDLVGPLHLADSVSLDPHKWLYQPVDCGCLLFRDRSAARRAFSQAADYTRSFSDDPVEGFTAFDESVELSRRFRALRLWLSLRYHGVDAFRAAIAADLRHARELAGRVAREPSLELLAPVHLSAVCFRHRSGGDVDAHNRALLERVNRRGRVYLSNATIRGAFALRACFVNHRTTDADVAAVVDEVLAAARDPA